jgi:hypothetical protein
MGYILIPISGYLGEVAAAACSRNKELLRGLVETFQSEFEQLDEMAADYRDEEADELELTMEEALT